MPKERNALKAGLFIIVCIAAAFAIVVAVKGTSFQDMQTRTVSFTLKDNLSGLRVGDEVRIGGFKVGEVRGIEVAPADDPRLAKRAQPPGDQAAILVTFTMPTKYQMREDTLIAIETTVTEKTCLNISRLGVGQPVAADVTLVGHPSALYAAMDQFADMAPRLGDILSKVEHETIPQINGVLADVRAKTLPGALSTFDSFRATADAATALAKTIHGQIQPIVNRYTEVAASAGKALDNMADLMGDNRSETDLRGTIKNLRSITETVEKKLPAMLDDVHSTVKDVNATVDTTRQVMANLKDASESAKSILSGNEARLQTMMKHLDQTAANMQGFSEGLRSRPWRLLYTPKKEELYNLTLFQSTRDFAQGASDLNDAATALHDAIHDNRATPEQIKKLLDQVQDRFDKFADIEKKLWSEVQK